MKWTITGLIVIGVIAALSAALLTASLRASALAKAEAENAPGAAPEVEILLATRALPAMSVVDSSAVAKQTMASNEVTPDMQTIATRVIGQVLIAPVVEGEAFRSEHFATAESGVHLASALPEGYRAMSILLSDDSGIAQILYPGSLVDVVGSFRMPSGRGRASGEVISVTLLQSVQVLTVGYRTIFASEDGEESLTGRGQDSMTNRKQQRMVTLMVSPSQAETLQLARVHGRLAIVLRNPLDATPVSSRGILLSNLSGELAYRLAAIAEMGTSRPPMTPPEAGRLSENEQHAGQLFDAQGSELPVWHTVVMRGSNVETLTFPLPQEAAQ